MTRPSRNKPMALIIAEREERLAHARRLAASGHTSAQIATTIGMSLGGFREWMKKYNINVTADRVTWKSPRLDSRRIIDGTLAQLSGFGALLDAVDFSVLSAAERESALNIVEDALDALTFLRRNLTKGHSHASTNHAGPAAPPTDRTPAMGADRGDARQPERAAPTEQAASA